MLESRHARNWSLAGLLLAAVAVGTPSIADELHVSQGPDRLWVEYRLDGVFDESIWSSLRSGLPSVVRHRLTLWERRSTLWDRKLAERSEAYRVVYDLLEETFDLFDDEGLLESNLDPPEVTDRVSASEGTPLADLQKLGRKGRYYVEVEIEVQPLTVREVRDLERWLNGRIHGDGGLARLSSQVIGIFKSRVGLGERTQSVRSTLFRRSEIASLPETPEER